MTDAVVVLPPGWRATNSNGDPIPGAKLKFFSSGTTTPATVYSDQTLATALGSEVICDAGGYPVSGGSTKTPVYTGAPSYKLRLTDSLDALVWEHDNLKGAVVLPADDDVALPSTPVISRTSATVLVAGDRGKLVNADPSGGSFAITLPSAVTAGDGWTVGVRHAGASTTNVVTVRTTGGETIGLPGQTTATAVTLTGLGHTYWITADGAGFTVSSEVPPLMGGGLPFVQIADRLTVPPSSPVGGARYLMNGTPTGAWATAGLADQDIAEADGNGGWLRYVPRDGYLGYLADENLLVQFRDTAWVDLSNITAPVATTLGVAEFLHLETSGTNGGTAAGANAWHTRTLNTSVHNAITGAALASNQVTLPVGKYLLTSEQTFGTNTVRSRSRVAVISGTTNVSAIYGLDFETLGSANDLGGRVLAGLLHVTATAVIEVQYYVNAAVTDTDLGYATTAMGDEQYARLTVLKLDTLQGPQGIQGTQGNDGLDASVPYVWSTATSGDPGSTKVRVNNATLASVTEVALHETAGHGASVAGWLDSLDDSTSAIRGQLHVSKEGAPENFLIVNLTAAQTDAGTYRTFAVTHVASAGSISNADAVAVLFVPKGDRGDAGLTVPDIGALSELTDPTADTHFQVTYDGTTARKTRIRTTILTPRQFGSITLNDTAAAAVNATTLNAAIVAAAARGGILELPYVGDLYISQEVRTRSGLRLVSTPLCIVKPTAWSSGGAQVSNVWVTGDETDRLQNHVTLEGLVVDCAGLVALTSRGFAQGGSVPSNQIILPASASAVDDFYNGQSLRIFHGTASSTTIYTVSDYVGSTRTATLTGGTLGATPDGTSYLVCANNDNAFGFARGAVGFRLRDCQARNVPATWVGGGGGKGLQCEFGVDDLLVEGMRSTDCEFGFSFQGLDGTVGSGAAIVPSAVRRIHAYGLTAVRCPIGLLIAGYDTTKDPDGDTEDSTAVISGLILEDCGGAGTRPSTTAQKQAPIILLEGQNAHVTGVKVIDTAGFAPYPGAAGTVGAGLTGRVGAMIAGWGRNCDIEIEQHADVERVWFLDNVIAVADDAAGGSFPGVPQNILGNRFSARYYGASLDDVVTQNTSGGSVATAEVQGRIVLDCVESAPAQVVGTSMAHVGLALDVTAPKTHAVTVTIASPGVLSLTAHGLSAGDRVVLNTTGALPTGLSPRTDYYVIATGLTADDFQVSTTPGGSAVNTSGSQSGSHALQHFYGAPGRVRVTGTAAAINALPDTWSDFLAGDTYADPAAYGNSALRVRDTSGAQHLTIKPGSNLTADRIFTLTTGDADRTLTVSSNVTLDQSVATTSTPTFAAVKVSDSDASHTLAIDTPSNLTADRTLGFATGDASRVVTLAGNPTLDDWFDQDVKAAASPTFASVRISDSDASHTLTIDTSENLSANRTLNFVMGDASRTITITGDATIPGGAGGDQDVNTTSTPTFAAVRLSDSDASHTLTLDTPSNLTADRTLNFATGDQSITVTFSGSPTLADWFDQSVKAAASPTFASVKVSDSDASHTLEIDTPSNLTANRTLSFVTGDASRTVTITGDATIPGGGGGDQDVNTTSTPTFAAVKLSDSDASHTLTLDTPSNLTADRTLNLTTGDASRTVTLSGNPTLDDWFDQSVKAAASPTFAAVKLSDSDASHTLTIDTPSNLTANRTLNLTTGDADRTLTMTGNATLNQDVHTTSTPTFASVKISDSDASHTLTIDTPSNLTANRTLNFATGDQDITVTFSGSPTLANWFDQDVKAAASPQFAGINVGHATDTTVSRVSAGKIAVEGVQVPSGAWTLVGSSTTISGGKITITDIPQTFTELLVYVELGSSDSASAALSIEADMQNGAGGYPLSVNITGAITLASSAHSGAAVILNYAISGATKYLMRQGWSNTGYATLDSDATADTVDAVRLISTTSGVPGGNIDAGTLYVFAR